MFYYRIKFVARDDDNQSITETGIVCGYDEAQAYNNLMAYYKDQHILSYQFQEWENFYTNKHLK